VSYVVVGFICRATVACPGPSVPGETMEKAPSNADLVKMIGLQVGEAIARNPESRLGFDRVNALVGARLSL
jgi:hypothetical protein